MRGHCHQRIVVLICALSLLFFTSLQSFAATMPAYNGRMNVAVGGVIQAKAGRWGFAANDPRVTATVGGVGASVTTLALGIAAGGIATVGWPALLLGALISGLVTGGVAIAQNGIIKWIFNTDGTITTVGLGGTAVDNFNFQGGYASMTAGAAYWTSGYNGVTYSGGSPYPVMLAIATEHYGSDLASISYYGGDMTTGGVGYHVYLKSYGSQPYENGGASYVSSNAPMSCNIGSYSRNGVCVAAPGYVPPVSDLTSSTYPPVLAALPGGELTKPMSDVLLAAAANSAWKSMQNIDGGALPWSASDPITPSDVADWRTANPSLMPTVGDVIAPIAPSGASSASVGPSATGSTSATPAPAPTPGTGDKVDLGVDPNIAPPSLEATPTASQILSPILNLMPDLKSFVVPSHTSTCPTGSFTAFSHTYTIDSQCALVESNRSIIEAAMLLVWSIVAVLVVLRA